MKFAVNKYTIAVFVISIVLIYVFSVMEGTFTGFLLAPLYFVVISIVAGDTEAKHV